MPRDILCYQYCNTVCTVCTYCFYDCGSGCFYVSEVQIDSMSLGCGRLDALICLQKFSLDIYTYRYQYTFCLQCSMTNREIYPLGIHPTPSHPMPGPPAKGPGGAWGGGGGGVMGIFHIGHTIFDIYLIFIYRYACI